MTFEDDNISMLHAKRMGDTFYISQYKTFGSACHQFLDEDKGDVPPSHYIAVMCKDNRVTRKWNLYLTARDGGPDSYGPLDPCVRLLASITHGIYKMPKGDCDVRTVKVSLPTLTSCITFPNASDIDLRPPDAGRLRVVHVQSPTSSPSSSPQQALSAAASSAAASSPGLSLDVDVVDGASDYMWACYPDDLVGRAAAWERARHKTRGGARAGVGASVADRRSTDEEEGSKYLRLAIKMPIWNTEISSLLLKFERGRVLRAR